MSGFRWGIRATTQCIVPIVKYGGGLVMVWGCFGEEGLGTCSKKKGLKKKKKKKSTSHNSFCFTYHIQFDYICILLLMMDLMIDLANCCEVFFSLIDKEFFCHQPQLFS